LKYKLKLNKNSKRKEEKKEYLRTKLKINIYLNGLLGALIYELNHFEYRYMAKIWRLLAFKEGTQKEFKERGLQVHRWNEIKIKKESNKVA